MDPITKRCPRCKLDKNTETEFGKWGLYKTQHVGEPRTYCRGCERLNSKEAYDRKRLRKVVDRHVELVEQEVYLRALEPVPVPVLVHPEKFMGYATCVDGHHLEVYSTSEGIRLRESKY